MHCRKANECSRYGQGMRLPCCRIAMDRIQLYVKRDEICPGEDKTLYDQVWKKLLDIGDIIGVKGYVFTTKTGETSVHVREFTLLTKSLKPLPVVKEAEGQTFDAVTDPEFRYRQRYADLIVNPQVKEVFVKRTKLMNAIREFLNEHGALEVDTPVLQTIPGRCCCKAFHHTSQCAWMCLFTCVLPTNYI